MAAPKGFKPAKIKPMVKPVTKVAQYKSSATTSKAVQARTETGFKQRSLASKRGAQTAAKAEPKVTKARVVSAGPVKNAKRTIHEKGGKYEHLAREVPKTQNSTGRESYFEGNRPVGETRVSHTRLRKGRKS